MLLTNNNRHNCLQAYLIRDLADVSQNSTNDSNKILIRSTCRTFDGFINMFLYISVVSKLCSKDSWPS
jgi:hypothetical protein